MPFSAKSRRPQVKLGGVLFKINRLTCLWATDSRLGELLAKGCCQLEQFAWVQRELRINKCIAIIYSSWNAWAESSWRLVDQEELWYVLDLFLLSHRLLTIVERKIQSQLNLGPVQQRHSYLLSYGSCELFIVDFLRHNCMAVWLWAQYLESIKNTMPLFSECDWKLYFLFYWLNFVSPVFCLCYCYFSETWNEFLRCFFCEKEMSFVFRSALRSGKSCPEVIVFP